MSLNVNNVNGGGSNGVSWNLGSSNGNVDENKAEDQSLNANVERKDVNPEDVMRFLANQNYFVPVKADAKVPGVEGVDAETQERIAGYMERFEELFAIIEDEFGAEMAPQVFDVAMDILLGMA